LAWLLDPVSREWGLSRLHEWGLAGCPNLCGVNVLAEQAVLEREPKLFSKLAQVLDVLIEEHGIFVLFLANEVRENATFDKVAAQRTRAEMKHADQSFIAPNKYISPQEMLSLIANCRTTVSMRYHFCLFSALQGVPFVAMERSDKVADLCWDLNWPFATAMNGLCANDLVRLFRAIEDERGTAIERLRTRVPSLRRRADENWCALETLTSRELVPIGTNCG